SPETLWESFDRGEDEHKGPRLFVFDPSTSDEFEIERSGGIGNYVVAARQPHILAFSADKLEKIVVSDRGSTERHHIPLKEARVRNDPAAVYFQMFEETWRS